MTNKIKCQICKDITSEEIIKIDCCVDSTYHQSCINVYLDSGKKKCPICQQQWDIETQNVIKKEICSCNPKDVLPYFLNLNVLSWILFLSQFILNIIIFSKYYTNDISSKIILTIFILMNPFQFSILTCLDKSNYIFLNNPSTSLRYKLEMGFYLNFMLFLTSSIYLILVKYIDIDMSHYKLFYFGCYFVWMMYLGIRKIKYTNKTKKFWYGVNRNILMIQSTYMIFCNICVSILFGFQLNTLINKTTYYYLTYALFALSTSYWIIQSIITFCFPDEKINNSIQDKKCYNDIDCCICFYPYVYTNIKSHNKCIAKFKWIYLYRKNYNIHEYWIKLPFINEFKIDKIYFDTSSIEFIGIIIASEYFWHWNVLLMMGLPSVLYSWVKDDYLVLYYNSMVIIQFLLFIIYSFKNYCVEYKSINNYNIKVLRNKNNKTGKPKNKLSVV